MPPATRWSARNWPGRTEGRSPRARPGAGPHSRDAGHGPCARCRGRVVRRPGRHAACARRGRRARRIGGLHRRHADASGSVVPLESGILAPCGCNCRRLNTIPALRRVVDDALADATRWSIPAPTTLSPSPTPESVGKDPRRTARPAAGLRARRSARRRRPARRVLARRGIRAVIIEDVVASGSSTARAIQALLAETGMRVAGVQSIANWNFPEMRARLASWTVRAITSYPQVLASAQEGGLVSAADVSELLRFYADPRGHSWNAAGEPPRQALCRRPPPSSSTCTTRSSTPRRATPSTVPSGRARRQPGALARLLPRPRAGRDAG